MQETAKEEAINEVLEIFKLENNYSEFELKINFKDGSKIKFEDEKQEIPPVTQFVK